MRRLQQSEIDDLFAMAARGGLAQATAITDCVAQGPDHLMYMEGDTLVLLRDAGDQLLAYCEGEVGWVKRANVVFDSPLASGSMSTVKAQSAQTTGTNPSSANQILHLPDERSTNSTPSRYSGGSGASGTSTQQPYTPCSVHSSFSTFSSQSTSKSSPSSPYTPFDVPLSSGGLGPSDTHDPSCNVTSPSFLSDTLAPMGYTRPVQVVEMPSKASPRSAEFPPPAIPLNLDPALTSNCQPNRQTFPSRRTDLPHPTGVVRGPRPPLPAIPVASGNNRSITVAAPCSNARHDRTGSISSANSEYSDAGDEHDSYLPYARSQPAEDTRDTSSPTPSLPATISLSALGVYSRPSLSTIPLRSVQPAIREEQQSRAHDNVRHVQHAARHLAVLTEPIYRQSFAAETARVSMAPSEMSVIDDNVDESGDIAERIPIPTADGSLSVPSSSLRRSPAFARLDLTIDSEKSNANLPPVDDAAYPLTPGTFGLGLTPKSPGSPELLPDVCHPSPNPNAPSTSSKEQVERVDGAQLNGNRSIHPLRSGSSRSSQDSSKDVDSTSHGHSEETILSTPQSIPIRSFTDSPLTEDPTSLHEGHLDTVEVVEPDSSMTDPLPPQKGSLTSTSASNSSLSVVPDKTPDSPTSVDSRWSVESRAAAKASMRNGFYALGHAPQLTESQQQSWRNRSVTDKLPSLHKASSSLSDSKPATRTAPDVATAVVDGSTGGSSENEIQEPVASTTSPQGAPTASPSISVTAPPNTTQSVDTSASGQKVDAVSQPNSQWRPGPFVPPTDSDNRREIVHVLPGQMMPKTWPGLSRDTSISSQPPPSQLRPRPPPLVGLGRPTTESRLAPTTGMSRPLVRRVTSPTVASYNEGGSDHIGPVVQQHPQRLQRRQTDNQAPSFANQHELNRVIPIRTSSSSSEDHIDPRLVARPSQLMSMSNRPSAQRNQQKVLSKDPVATPRTPKPKGSFSSLTGSILAPSLSSTPPPVRKESLGEQEVITPTSSNAPSLSRSRSRSFSAALAKSLGKASRGKLSIDIAPPLPTFNNGAKEELVGSNSFDQSTKPGFLRSHSSASSISDFGSYSIRPSNDSTRSNIRPWLSHSRSASSPRSPFHPPVSHRDYADPTVNADGMEFEIIRPRKVAPASPVVQVNVDSSDLGILPSSEQRPVTSAAVPGTGANSPPELDEWGFIKSLSPTPEIFTSRQSPGEVRAAEQKWLSIIQQPLGYRQPAPKKVRRLVIEHGVPASLRGRVWGWFMSNGMSGRVDDLFQRLLTDEPGPFDEQIDIDIQAVYSDHSAFHRKDSPGQADLRTLLRAYIHFAPSGYRTDIARLAGALLIHAVLEDAFWLLAGLFNGVLKSYYVLDTKAFIIDLNVFGGILEGSEPQVGQLFRSLGVLPEHYLVKWWSGMFIRSLPWPTVLRIMDAVVSEGSRYLMIASLAILTLSRDRLLQLPRKQAAIVEYLHHLPQDSLLLPETFMRACDQVKLRDEDLKKLRLSVKKQMATRE